ncbi:MAG: hypothetical protein JJ970_09610 [Erythrobacter sp.]|uniref:hypothetical protein n=1 Tax=Erythrobacter sp. TaxID=1042 RepID=UPI001B1EAB04|nr:hypothetical protein [Erythrobacter sp.]MBO6530279.1 hypothetical protein [Erythrobacter sp.]
MRKTIVGVSLVNAALALSACGSDDAEVLAVNEVPSTNANDTTAADKTVAGIEPSNIGAVVRPPTSADAPRPESQDDDCERGRFSAPADAESAAALAQLYADGDVEVDCYG